MGKLFDSVDGCVTVPNPSLKPEYADNVEIGIAKRFGSFLTADVTAYYTHLDNAIVRRDCTFDGSPTMEYGGEECRVQALQNAAVANVWGVQAAVDARFAKWFYANARVSWQHGREELDNGDKSPSRHAAPLFGRAAIGYKCDRLTVEAFTAFQAECSVEDMPEEEKEKTEFYALDADGNAYRHKGDGKDIPECAADIVRAHHMETPQGILLIEGDKTQRPGSFVCHER
jgi:hemoglobin/transferrin/lactoferrin receptor protein